MRSVLQIIWRKYLKAPPSVMASIFLSSATIASISCNSCTYIWRWIFETLWNMLLHSGIIQFSNIQCSSRFDLHYIWLSWQLAPCQLRRPSFEAFPAHSLPLPIFRLGPATWTTSDYLRTLNQRNQIQTLRAAGSPRRLRAEVEPNKENDRWNARKTEVILPPIVDLPQTRCLYIFCLFSTTSPKAASTIAAMTWPKQIITWNQGGRTWQAFGGGKNGLKTFRQARVYNFRDKCVVFARNLKFSNLTQ